MTGRPLDRTNSELESRDRDAARGALRKIGTVTPSLNRILLSQETNDLYSPDFLLGVGLMAAFTSVSLLL
jgi:hypothetical protein